MARELQSRNDTIFDIIVRSYIDTAEPVGSRTISRRHEIGLSSASIRNVMADLEEQGYLAQPHTSAGRVPTDKGYRYWVDSLMQREELTKDEKDRIERALSKSRTISDLAERISKLISELTENAAMTYVKSLKRVSFLSHLLEEIADTDKLSAFFEEEPELFIDGASRFFEQPEFRDLAKLRTLLRAFEDKDSLFAVLHRDLNGGEGVHVHIGRENGSDDLSDVSMVVKDWYLGDTPFGGVAVVGPTRMRYSRIVTVVEYVADSISDAIERF